MNSAGRSAALRERGEGRESKGVEREGDRPQRKGRETLALHPISALTLRVHHPAQEENGSRSVVTNQEQEGMVGTEDDDLRDGAWCV
jgi:hypothetical protein